MNCSAFEQPIHYFKVYQPAERTTEIPKSQNFNQDCVGEADDGLSIWTRRTFTCPPHPTVPATKHGIFGWNLHSKFVRPGNLSESNFTLRMTVFEKFPWKIFSRTIQLGRLVSHEGSYCGIPDFIYRFAEINHLIWTGPCCEVEVVPVRKVWLTGPSRSRNQPFFFPKCTDLDMYIYL